MCFYLSRVAKLLESVIVVEMNRYEADTNAMIRQYLEILKARGGFFFMRVNSGAVYGEDYRGNRLAFEGAGAGTADWLCLVGEKYYHYQLNSRVIWLEAKSATGKQSDRQKLFHAWVVMDLGHEYYLVRDSEDMDKIFGGLE